jgi:anti-anti-sigma factor
MSSVQTLTKSPQTATVVKFQGQILDDQTVQGVVEHLVQQAKKAGGHVLHLDLGDVDYMTASCLGGLIDLRQQLLSVGIGLTLGNVKRRVYEVFKLTRLTQVFDVHPKQAGQAGGPRSLWAAPMLSTD